MLGALGESLNILAGAYGLLVDLTHRASPIAENTGADGPAMTKIGEAIARRV